MMKIVNDGTKMKYTDVEMLLLEAPSTNSRSSFLCFEEHGVDATGIRPTL